MGLDRRHHRYSIGSDSRQSTNSFTSFINVINLIILLGEFKTFFNSSYMHRRFCRVKNMLAMYLKYHKAGLTPTNPVTSTAISPVKISIGRKSLTNLRSEMIFLQGKPIFYIFLPSTPPYWQIILRFCWQWTPKWQQSESRSRATYFHLSGFI